MKPPSDEELTVRFEELRDDDHAGAPDFRAVLNRAQSRERGRLRATPWAWAAVAASVVFAAGIALHQARNREAALRASSMLDAPGGSSISTWRSPTASLLRVSGSEVLGAPKIRSSILDGATRGAVQP